MDINYKLKELEKQKDILLKKHGGVSLPTEESIKEYIEINRVEITQLKLLIKEIRDIKLQMMSSQERKEYLEEQKKISEKHSGEWYW